MLQNYSLVFFTFFNLYIWYQIVKSVTLSNKLQFTKLLLFAPEKLPLVAGKG